MEAEGGWLLGRSAEDWGRLSEGGNPMEDRDISLADIEINFGK
jgi:hypothetical protein